MAAWTNTTGLPPELPRPRTATDAGALRAADGSGITPVYRPPAGPRVAPYVERYWSVVWATPGPAAARRQVLSHPAVHLTVTTTGRAGSDRPAAAVRGVVTGTFAVDLLGTGRVVGAKFRPGGFTGLTGLDASTLTDRSVPLADLLDPDRVQQLLDRVAAAPDDADGTVAAIEGLLAELVPARTDPAYELVLTVVHDMLTDHALGRVEEVAARHGLTPRSLQRLFRRFVGVGPKWVLRRYRLHDAITAIDTDPGVLDLAGLAAWLGWADQPHFTRDFTAAVGVSPHVYAARPR